MLAAVPFSIVSTKGGGDGQEGQSLVNLAQKTTGDIVSVSSTALSNSRYGLCDLSWRVPVEAWSGSAHRLPCALRACQLC
jgi:hypothetical protein